MFDVQAQMLTEQVSSTEQIRVLMLTPFYQDDGCGVGTAAKELRDGLTQQGATVDILLWWPLFNEPVFIDAQENRTPLADINELLNSDREYDVLHFQSSAFTERVKGGFFRILQRYPVPSTYTVHCLAAFQGETMRDMAAQKKFIDDQIQFIRHTDHTLLLTDELLEITKRYHPEFSDKYRVIENGTNHPVEFSKQEVAVEAKRLNKQLNIKADEDVLLFMGRVSPEKGIFELVQALPALRKKYPQLHLVIAGDKQGNPNVTAIKALLDKAGMVEGVHHSFAGWAVGVTREALYDIADMVILPSYYEHMPLSALEAMIRKRPVIMTDIESCRRLFSVNDAKLRCLTLIRQSEDIGAVVDAVSIALSDRKELNRVAANGYRLVSQKFTWEKIARRYHRLFGELIVKDKAQKKALFEDDFQQKIDSSFKLNFDGQFALKVNDYGNAVRVFEQSLQLVPRHEQTPELLIQAYQGLMAQIRQRLETQHYDINYISQMQSLSQKCRLMLIQRQLDTPVISIVTPVYLTHAHPQGAQYLCEAILSCIEQSFVQPYEQIIVDDNSQLNISEIIMANFKPYLSQVKTQSGEVLFEQPVNRLFKIVIIKKKHNSGNDVTPRNIGLIEALKGGCEYIAHIDADDRMTKQRLQTGYSHMQKNHSTDFIHGGQRCIDEHGQFSENNTEHSQIAEQVWFNKPQTPGANKRHDVAELKGLMQFNWILGGSIMYRSNLLLRVGLDNLTPTQNYGADHFYWQKLSKVATMDYINSVFTEYRIHPGSMSQGGR